MIVKNIYSRFDFENILLRRMLFFLTGISVVIGSYGATNCLSSQYVEIQEWSNVFLIKWRTSIENVFGA